MGDIVKKKIALFVGIGCLFTLSVKAQLVDMIAGSAIQGQIAAQSASGLKTAMNAVQQNKLISQLNLLIADIRMRTMGNYSNLNHHNLFLQNC